MPTTAATAKASVLPRAHDGPAAARTHGRAVVISDQHAGNLAGLLRSFQGAARRRCRLLLTRALLALVPMTRTGPSWAEHASEWSARRRFTGSAARASRAARSTPTADAAACRVCGAAPRNGVPNLRPSAWSAYAKSRLGHRPATERSLVFFEAPRVAAYLAQAI